MIYECVFNARLNPIKYPLVMNVSVMQQSVHYISMYVFNSQLEKRGTILTLFGGLSITHSAICVCSSIQFSGGWVKLLSAITCTNLIISCFWLCTTEIFQELTSSASKFLRIVYVVVILEHISSQTFGMNLYFSGGSLKCLE